jgi:hypothetical protein
MRKILFFVLLLCFGNIANAQLTGVKAIPGDYASISAAVTDLNTMGVGAGGVTFNIAAGYVENLTGRIAITATGTGYKSNCFSEKWCRCKSSFKCLYRR